MKKRWIPFLVLCMAAVFILGLRMGAVSEAEQHQVAQETVSATIAVVNADAGTYINGTSLNYAAAIINTLDSRFTLVSPAMAQTGLNSGMYSAIITFPSNVSTRILSFNAYQPERVTVDFVISPMLSDREFLETHLTIMELQLAINTTLANTYVSSILRQFHEAQDQVSGIFQNSLADFMALELLTLGNFTDGLELDQVPHIPLNPRELDTEFYFGQVQAFAEEISGWYLRSYERASESYLRMREGLIVLTENFPEQENMWIDMLTHWTSYSEEYGRLLEMYAAYVSDHEQSLYEWFRENVEWNRDLGSFQRQLANWHYTSQEWFIRGEEWHYEYLGYVNSVAEFQTALRDFQRELSGSSVSVQNELNDWLRHLESFKQNLYRQTEDLRDMVELYNRQAYEEGNEFLDDLTEWHLSLIYHFNFFVDWLEYLDQRQYYLNDFHYELVLSWQEMQDVQEIIDIFVEKVDELFPVPEFPVCDYGYYKWDFGGLLYGVDRPSVPYLPQLSTLNYLPALGWGNSLPPAGYLPTITSIPPLPNITLEPIPDYLLFEIPDHVAWQLQGWFSSQVSNIEFEFAYWGDVAKDAADTAFDLYLQAQSEMQIFRDRYAELENSRDTINNMSGIIVSLHSIMDDEIGKFYEWHNTLDGISDILYGWEYRLHNHTEDMKYWHYSLSYFAENLDQLTMPELPDYLDLAPLEPDYRAYVGSLDEPVSPTNWLVLPRWNEAILSPQEYDGAQIADALNRDFPLDGHVMREPFPMRLPPEYTGMSQPDEVGYHFMTIVPQPQNPLRRPPPRPVDFWRSLDRMHGQLMSFDVGDFLSDDVHRMVDRSLASYYVFLDDLRESQVHLFSGNVLRMYEVHNQYNHFLHELRHDAFTNHRDEHELLQSAIDIFATGREDSFDDNHRRVGEFATMMPETRMLGGVNQSVVDFTTSPFEFTTFTFGYYDAPVIATVTPMADTYDRYLRIIFIVLAVVFFATVVGGIVLKFTKMRK